MIVLVIQRREMKKMNAYDPILPLLFGGNRELVRGCSWLFCRGNASPGRHRVLCSNKTLSVTKKLSRFVPYSKNSG